jgi:hypothetical protein
MNVPAIPSWIHKERNNISPGHLAGLLPIHQAEGQLLRHGKPIDGLAFCNSSLSNPIAQPMIVNRAQVDMAIMVGLCIGHDTLCIKYCNVPLTVRAVKDRVLGHNALAALYHSDSYYRRLRNGIK